MFLSRSIAVYIPSNDTIYDEETKETLGHYWSAQVIKLLTTLTGGTTSTEVSGTWLDKNGEIVFDNILLVKTFCRISDYTSIKYKIRQMVLKMGEALKQEAMAVEWHDGLEIIDIPSKSS